MRRSLPVVAVLVLTLTAGCLGGGTAPATDTPDGPPSTDTATDTPTATPPPTTTSERRRTTMEYPYGTEFVSVDPLDDQRRGNVSKQGFVAFGNLSEREQTVFLRALETGDRTFRPDSGRVNPFGFNDDDRPQFVRYEGTWYYVQVAIV